MINPSQVYYIIKAEAQEIGTKAYQAVLDSTAVKKVKEYYNAAKAKADKVVITPAKTKFKEVRELKFLDSPTVKKVKEKADEVITPAKKWCKESYAVVEKKTQEFLDSPTAKKVKEKTNELITSAKKKTQEFLESPAVVKTKANTYAVFNECIKSPVAKGAEKVCSHPRVKPVITVISNSFNIGVNLLSLVTNVALEKLQTRLKSKHYDGLINDPKTSPSLVPNYETYKKEALAKLREDYNNRNLKTWGDIKQSVDNIKKVF